MNKLEQCKQEDVATGGLRMHYHRCYRKAVKDGFCKQHHPDAVEARRKKSADKYEADEKKTAWYLLGEAQGTIRELKRILKSALTHQVANPGTNYEYYKCYTYAAGELPQWVHSARRELKGDKS